MNNKIKVYNYNSRCGFREAVKGPLRTIDR